MWRLDQFWTYVWIVYKEHQIQAKPNSAIGFEAIEGIGRERKIDIGVAKASL